MYISNFVITCHPLKGIMSLKADVSPYLKVLLAEVMDGLVESLNVFILDQFVAIDTGGLVLPETHKVQRGFQALSGGVQQTL